MVPPWVGQPEHAKVWSLGHLLPTGGVLLSARKLPRGPRMLRLATESTGPGGRRRARRGPGTAPRVVHRPGGSPRADGPLRGRPLSRARGTLEAVAYPWTRPGKLPTRDLESIEPEPTLTSADSRTRSDITLKTYAPRSCGNFLTLGALRGPQRRGCAAPGARVGAVRIWDLLARPRALFSALGDVSAVVSGP